MSALRYCVVDAFAEEPLQGNPAAVVLDAGGLTDSTMQRLAAEFNLSETAFLLPASGRAAGPAVRLRWFTPRCEVGFCGHATLAAVHAWSDAATAGDGVRVECAAGDLSVRTEAIPPSRRVYWLESTETLA